jgi:hypothetical protein
MSEIKKLKQRADLFVEGVDYYFHQGLMILTEEFLTKRGFCCGNGCRHCPYPKEKIKLQEKSV